MLWTKAFIIFFIILNLTNGYYVYYSRSRNHRHRHMHNCEFQKCVRRRGPPACKQWCLVYYFDGYCRRARYECCSYKEKPGYCPADPRFCAWPFPYYSTKTYECRHDFNCPSGYKCCNDSCYTHKVCKPCSSVPPQPGITPSSSTRDTEETTVKTTKILDTTIPIEKTTIKETTTEILTTQPKETTTYVTTTTSPRETTTVLTTTTPKITTTEKVTTTSRPTETTTPPTTQKETTTPVETTSTKTTTTSPVTTQRQTTTAVTKPATQEVTTTTTVKTTVSLTTPLTTVPPRTTTEEEIEGSGTGSGDYEVPDPEPARFLLKKGDFGSFSDDEDFVEAVMN